MTEEKKDHDDFLSNHEALLNNLAKKKEAEQPAEESEADAVESPAETPAAEKPVEEPAPVAEEVPEKPEPVAEEPEVVVNDPIDDLPEVVVAKPAKLPPKKKKPATPAEAKKQKHETLENAEVKEVLSFFMKYIKPVAIAVAVVCAVFLTTNYLKHSRQKKEVAADSALQTATTIAEYQAILDQYGSTPTAPLALMGLAQATFNAGQIDEAEKLYGDFTAKFPKHELAVQAAYNQITCKEAKGELGEASILYGDFKAKHEKSHLAPAALLGKARCFEALDNYSEAKVVYEDIITFYPESGWAQIAERQLAVAMSKLK
ncbi:tetratricopeptide repeat protein [Pontiella sp.]|uniref:tetratricopeptide repeat protein n=1 Tax=Pontiella sp. TaxID=2837462 RepID=UPI0035642632